MDQDNKNEMGEQSTQNTSGDGLYHYSYIQNKADSRFDRPGQGENSSYSGFGNNVNGMEAMYSSQRMNRESQSMGCNSSYAHGRPSPSESFNQQGRPVQQGRPAQQAGPSQQAGMHTQNCGNMNAQNTKNPQPPKNRKEKKGLGMKFLGLVAAAAVFGLVAAAVFQGVRYGTDRIIDRKDTTKEASIDNSSTEVSTESKAPQIQSASTDATSTVYDVASVAKKVMPSIVSITGTYVTTYDYWFDSYQQESTGAGSGIIIGKDDKYLYIATNYHVVKDAKALSVTFVDDNSTDATVKGYVEGNDVAVVTVKLSDISDSTLSEIKEIQVGSSDDLNVGDPCVAIGNALGYGQSVTVGYISALDRQVSATDESITVLQTDAAINPGNSGGALVNMNGELIGINTAKYLDTSVEGMGYALPISDVQDIINDLIAGKSVAEDGTTSGQAYLGISGQTITSQYSELLRMPEGVYVSSVEPGSAAEECGIQSGDVICSIDGEDIADMETLHDRIVANNPGDKVTIVYYRNNNGSYEKQTATATLKEKQ